MHYFAVFLRICFFVPQVGTATPDDISFDLADLKFYDDEDRIVNNIEAFAMNCTNTGCNCTNTVSPEPRNAVVIIQGSGEPRQDLKNDKSNAACSISVFNAVNFAVVLSFYYIARLMT